MIKNFVFDIGNVLVDFGWKPFFDGFGMPDDVFERLKKATVMDPDWDEIDRGLLEDDEVLKLFIENDPGIEEWLRKVFVSINGMLVRFDHTKKLIEFIQKRGYKVYCLSNMSHKAVRECNDALDFLPMLDGYILSCDVNLCKPEKEIYEALFEKYSLKPEECVFIDDLERNIEAAKKLGMDTVLYKSPADIMNKLEEIDDLSEPKTYTKLQRGSAVACIVLICFMFGFSLVSAILKVSFAKELLIADLLLPILAWCYIWMVGKLTHKKTIADFNFFKTIK